MRVLDGVQPKSGQFTASAQTPRSRTWPQATVSSLAASAVLMDGLRPRALIAPADQATNIYQAPEAAGRRWSLPYVVGVGALIPMLAVASIVLVQRLHTTTLFQDKPQSKANASSSSEALARARPTAAAAAQPAKPAEPTQAEAALAAQTAALQKFVSDYAAAQPAGFTVMVKDLKTGAVAHASPDSVLTSASLYKLFVALAVYRGVDTGQYSLNQRVAGQTIASCLNNMITWSDNNCGTALGQLVGWEKQNGALSTAGFTHTNLKTLQRTSASDVTLLFERLYNGTLLSPNSSQQFLSLLKNQKVNNRLPVGLPAGTTIAHKTGDLNGYYHDAGIVYGPKTDYIVSVVSGPWANQATAYGTIADFSRKLFAQFNQ